MPAATAAAPTTASLAPTAAQPDGTLTVLLSAFACSPDSGSEEGVGWHWAIEIARMGHRVLVLTSTVDRDAIEAAVASGELPANLSFDFLMPEWLRRCFYGGVPLQIVHLMWQILAWRHARALVARHRFDLVQHLTYCGIRQPSLMGRLPIPFVLGPVGGGETAPFPLRHGMGVRGWWLDLIRDGLNLLLRIDPITRGALASARLIFVTSPDTARLVPRRHRHKVKVQLQIGISMPDAAEAEPVRAEDGPLRLLYVGRCLAWKGMHLGLEAIAELRRRGRPARLSIAGRGAAEGPWRQLAAQLDLEDAIDWLEWIDHRRMPEVYREHDALLFPSLHDSGGQVVLEALSHGKPVICLDLGGPGTIVTNDCGRVVATGGRTKEQVVAALADALQEISDSPLLRQRLSQAALARARGYDWPTQVQAAYAAITDVLTAETGEHDRPGQRLGR